MLKSRVMFRAFLCHILLMPSCVSPLSCGKVVPTIQVICFVFKIGNFKFSSQLTLSSQRTKHHLRCSSLYGSWLDLQIPTMRPEILSKEDAQLTVSSHQM